MSTSFGRFNDFKLPAGHWSNVKGSYFIRDDQLRLQVADYIDAHNVALSLKTFAGHCTRTKAAQCSTFKPSE